MNYHFVGLGVIYLPWAEEPEHPDLCGCEPCQIHRYEAWAMEARLQPDHNNTDDDEYPF